MGDAPPSPQPPPAHTNASFSNMLNDHFARSVTAKKPKKKPTPPIWALMSGK